MKWGIYVLLSLFTQNPAESGTRTMPFAFYTLPSSTLKADNEGISTGQQKTTAFCCYLILQLKQKPVPPFRSSRITNPVIKQDRRSIRVESKEGQRLENYNHLKEAHLSKKQSSL